MGWTTIRTAGEVLNGHLAYGDIHFVYATHVDSIRLRSGYLSVKRIIGLVTNYFVDVEVPGNGVSSYA